MDQADRPLSPEFWSSPAVAAALASCDFATLLEEIRRAHGWTQKQLALAAGYSQSWVSNVLRRQQALTVDQVREISRRIGVPVPLLRFGDPGGEDPTKRRDFGKAMALALVPLPTRAAVDETTAPTLTAITGAQRRLDATTSARELARGVTAHVEMANRLLARARPARRVHARQPGRIRDRRRRPRARAHPRRRGTPADRRHPAPVTPGLAGRHRGPQLRRLAP